MRPVQIQYWHYFNLHVLKGIVGLFQMAFHLCGGTYITHPSPFSESKFNLKSDRVNFVAPASPIECLRYLPNLRAIQYKLGPDRLTRLGNSNVIRLPVTCPIPKGTLKAA